MKILFFKEGKSMLSKKKKIFILLGMAVLLVVTGYLNVALNNNANQTLSNQNTTADFFATYRDDRTYTRNLELEYLDAIITSASSTSDYVATATSKKLALVAQMEKELILEGLIAAAGYEDAIVTASDDNLNVMVKTNGFTADDASKILSLVVGLGAQPLIEDIFAGVFIVFEHTFDIGDIIVVVEFHVHPQGLVGRGDDAGGLEVDGQLGALLGGDVRQGKGGAAAGDAQTVGGGEGDHRRLEAGAAEVAHGYVQLDLLPGLNGLGHLAAGDEHHGGGGGLLGLIVIGTLGRVLIDLGLGDGHLQGLIAVRLPGPAYLQPQRLAGALVLDAGEGDGIDQRRAVGRGPGHGDAAAGKAVVQLGDVQGGGTGGAGAVAGVLDGDGDIGDGAFFQLAQGVAAGGDGIACHIEVSVVCPDGGQEGGEQGQNGKERAGASGQVIVHGWVLSFLLT